MPNIYYLCDMKKKLLAMLILAFAGSFALGAFDRGLGNPNSVYTPKGTFATSYYITYNNWNASAGDDLTKGVSLFGLIPDVNGNLSNLGFSAGLSWFFKDNWSIGALVGYDNRKIDSNHLSMLKGMVDLSNQHSRTETYSGSIRVRRYIPLFGTRIIALLTEGRLGGSFGYDKTYAETDRGKEGLFSANYSVFGRLYAGVSVFFTNFTALEIAFPVFGASYDWSNQIEKQEYESKLTGFSFRDRTNPLGVTLGIVYHF